MLQWFLRFSEFPEFTEFNESSAPFRENSMRAKFIFLKLSYFMDAFCESVCNYFCIQCFNFQFQIILREPSQIDSRIKVVLGRFKVGVNVFCYRRSAGGKSVMNQRYPYFNISNLTRKPNSCCKFGVASSYFFSFIEMINHMRVMSSENLAKSRYNRSEWSAFVSQTVCAIRESQLNHLKGCSI